MMSTPTDKLRCFLVEDSAILLSDLTQTLEQALALEVVGSARDELSATDWLRQNPGACDLVIVDIFLKSGVGLNVLVAARRHAAQASRIVLTNHASDAIRRRCQSLDADRVFDKSTELDLLIAYCGELCGSPLPS